MLCRLQKQIFKIFELLFSYLKSISAFFEIKLFWFLVIIILLNLKVKRRSVVHDHIKHYWKRPTIIRFVDYVFISSLWFEWCIVPWSFWLSLCNSSFSCYFIIICPFFFFNCQNSIFIYFNSTHRFDLLNFKFI